MVCIDRIFLLLFSFLPHFGYCDESSLAESGRDRFPEVCQPGGHALCSVSLEGIPCALSARRGSHVLSAWRGSPVLCQPGGDPRRSAPWCPSPSAALMTPKALRSHAQSEAPYSLQLILYKGTRTGRWVAVAILGTYLVTLGSSGAQFHHH